MASSAEEAQPQLSGQQKEVAAEKKPVEPIRLPTPEEIRGQDIWNNCVVRSAVSGVMDELQSQLDTTPTILELIYNGGGLGLCMGLFFGALDNPILHTQEDLTARQQFVFTAKQMGRRSWSSCKTFAVMGLIFSAAECVIEKARAKHDATNTVVAGCVTGGALSAKGGPQAACIGCAGFATFSVLIEKFLDGHD